MTATTRIQQLSAIPLVALLAVACVTSGCKSLPTFGKTAARDDETIDDVSGPLQRVLARRAGGSPAVFATDESDRKQLNSAQAAYEAKDYDASVELLTDVVKRRNPRRFKLFQTSRRKTVDYDPIREEAAFYLAESEYQRQHYPAAQKHYTMLIKDYPSTRYMDESTRRLFEIARYWLPVDDFATAGEIQQVAFEDRKDKPLSSVGAQKKRFGWLPNLRDKSRPVVDTSGHAINALKTIWLNDPSGPLADDALMLAATFHLRSENYREADRMLTLLREEFPKSTHLQTAFVLGSHVKLMSYQGAKYEEQPLKDAQQLKQSTLRLFNNLPEADRLRRDLKRIHEAEAQRDWELVLLYEKKRKPRSVVVYCREVIRRFPDTSYAALARKKLSEYTGADQSPGSVQLDPPPDQEFRSEPTSTTDDGPVFEQNAPIFDDPPRPAGSSPGRTSLSSPAANGASFKSEPAGRTQLQSVPAGRENLRSVPGRTSSNIPSAGRTSLDLAPGGRTSLGSLGGTSLDSSDRTGSSTPGRSSFSSPGQTSLDSLGRASLEDDGPTFEPSSTGRVRLP